MEARLDLALLIHESPMPENRSAETAEDDASLVIAASRGDRAAFGQLYQRHARTIHGIALAHVSFADVDDLVQDVFLTALRKLDSLREPAAFAGWLIVIARNRAHDFHRRSRPADELTEQSASIGADEGEAQAALEAIRSLPEAYRETLILRLVEGMSGPEISARTGLTSASVRVNLHRGMKQLREKLGERSGKEPRHE